MLRNSSACRSNVCRLGPEAPASIGSCAGLRRAHQLRSRLWHSQRLDRLRTVGASRTDTLRRLLKQPGILQGPCCHDALSAKLIEDAGFPFAFMSGFCTAGAKLGAPDTGLISYGEMVDQGRYIHEATRRMPIIGDGDTGYGNALNVKRTVKGYAAAGFAGILIEDQVAPKSCGHVRGKRVVDREEAVSRIRAAVDARDEGADILIVARTDARQAVSLEEALARADAFADAGADILFIDALESRGEMRALCGLGGQAARVPKMASMLEGGGKTPLVPTGVLEAMGFKLVAYPLSLLGVSIHAMQKALRGLKAGVVPPVEDMGTFADIQAAVGFTEYYREEERYAIHRKDSGRAAGPSGTAGSPTSSSPDTDTQSGPGMSRSASVSWGVGADSSTVPLGAPGTPAWDPMPPRSSPQPPPAQPPPTPPPPPTQPPPSSHPKTSSSSSPPPYGSPSAATAAASTSGSRKKSWSRSAGVPFGTARSGTDGTPEAPAGGTSAAGPASSVSTEPSSAPPSSPPPYSAPPRFYESEGSSRMGSSVVSGSSGAAPEVVEPEVVFDDAGATSRSPVPLRGKGQVSEEDAGTRLRNATLRVRITDTQTSMVKLETRIPAAFLSGVAAVVPQVSGMDLQGLLDRALRGGPGGDSRQQLDGSLLLVNFDSGVDIVQVFLEM